MLDNIERFDMIKKPKRQSLRFLIWLLCIPSTWAHKTKITKINVEGLKPPYIVYANHNAFYDFKVAERCILPHRSNYVVAIDGFIGREGLLRTVGGICKRKFTNDITLIKQIKRVIDNKDIIVIYPEARYSLCGTRSDIPYSCGKLVKMLKVPVVTLICHGHHINHPFWNTRYERKVKNTEAVFKCVATKEEVLSLSNEEIFNRINKEFDTYNDFKWQKDHNIKVKDKNRAVGLEKVLYQCPHCLKEYHMLSFGTHLLCNDCKKEWEMTELGELKALEGDDYFTTIYDWYNWERDRVREEVREGKYNYSFDVQVDSLPNSKGYIDIGKATLVHNMDGFSLDGEYNGEKYHYFWPAESQYSCHIEYEYLFKKGDCVDLNTLNDTFYIYPKGEFSVTKISLACEELYKFKNNTDIVK